MSFQIIKTRYLGPTNTRTGSYVAQWGSDRAVIADDGKSDETGYAKAALTLLRKLVDAGQVKPGTLFKGHDSTGRGCYVFVYVPKGDAALLSYCLDRMP